MQAPSHITLGRLHAAGWRLARIFRDAPAAPKLFAAGRLAGELAARGFETLTLETRSLAFVWRRG